MSNTEKHWRRKYDYVHLRNYKLSFGLPPSSDVMTYLYDPRTNLTIKTTLEYVLGVTGNPMNSIMTYRSKKNKMSKIGMYISMDPPDIEQRKEWYAIEKYENEHFLLVEGSNNQFKVSNYGRIKRVYKNGNERFMMPFQRKGIGNLHAKARFLGEYKDHRIGHIVAHHFIGKRNKDLRLVRKNGIITDDYAGNLEYISKEELGKRTGHLSGSNPIVQLDLETGEYVNEFRSIREAGRELYLSHEAIRVNVLGRSTHSGGFKFMCLNEYEAMAVQL